MTPAKTSLKHTLVLFLLTAATLIVYWNVSEFEFINLDDNIYVWNNRYVQNGLTADGIQWAFTLAKPADTWTYWLPLTSLSHMLDCQLFGLDAGKHHLVNLFIHIFNAILLYLILFKMTGDVWRCAFVAAFFAVHPLNVDSVAWIAERKNLLSTTFWMLTMLAYVRYARRPSIPRYLIVFVAMTAGLLSKPMLVTLPCVLLLMDFWPLGRLRLPFARLNTVGTGSFPSASPGRLISEKIPLLVIAFLSILTSIISLKHHNQIIPHDTAPMLLRMENALVSYVKYIGKIFWPHDMAIYYPFPEAIPPWQVLGAAAILTGTSVIVILLLKKTPYLTVGWLWFIGTLTPVIGIIQGGLWPEMADRWTYVPAIGIFIMIGWGGAAIVKKYSLPRSVAAILAIGILIPLAISARNQVAIWQNSITLFSHVLKVTKNNDVAHYNLAESLAKKGSPDQAIPHYEKALIINPRLANAHNNLGNILAKKGQIDEAGVRFRQALKIDPELTEVHNNLGNILMHNGRLDEALYHYEIVVYKEGRDSVTVKNREALLSLLTPDQQIQILFKIAVRFAGEKQFDPAIDLFRKILVIAPEKPIIYYNISCLYARKNQNTEAIDWLRQAVAHGYDQWDNLRNDPDMKNIIDEPYVRELIKGL